MIKSDGSLIPMILGSAGHEIGMNSESGVRIEI